MRMRTASATLLAASSVCLAQTAPPQSLAPPNPATTRPPAAAQPPTNPLLDGDPQAIPPARPPRRDEATISPTPTRALAVLPAAPGPTPTDLARLQSNEHAAPPLRREGTFLVRARGVLTRLPGGESAFIFAKDSTGKAERPMVLLPCHALQRMEQVAGRQAAAFALTGQVFVYSGVNYVLPSEAPLLPPEAVVPASATPDSQHDNAPATTPPPAANDDPSVQELIQRLAWQRERPRSIDRTDTVEPRIRQTGGEAPELLPEGRTVVRRKGRMVRAADGGWMFSMDSTPDAKADAPLVLLPCANLQRLDAWAGGVGDAATVEITGRVTTYNERNFLLITMFRMLPTSEVTAK
ncbi:MAG: hypothetical protein ACKVW3_04010 [Phycisphaerales bacterium]